MSDTPGGPDWWQASDGKWYPPETHPNYSPPPLPPPAAPAMTGSPSTAPPPVTATSPVIVPSNPWWKRWWAFAIGVLVVIGAVAAVAGGGGDDDAADTLTPTAAESEDSDEVDAEEPSVVTEVEPPSDTEPEATTATTQPEDTSPTATAAPEEGLSLAAPAAVGEAVVVGDWTIRVAAVTPDAAEQVAAQNQFNDPPAPGKQFFMATLEATYTGSESSTFWLDMTLKAIGASNVAYEGGFDTGCGVLPNDIDNSGEAFPGGTISANVCWAIDAADAATMTLLAEPSFSFGTDERRFLSMDPAAVPIDDSTAKNAPSPMVFDGVPIGEPAEVGDWTITVVSVVPDASAEIAAENQFNAPPAPGRQFFMAAIEATYNGSESSTFWVDLSLSTVGASAIANDGFGASCGVMPKDINDAGETFPGGTISGNLCWSIDVGDAASLVMLASESLSFDDDRVVFSLTE